MQRIVRVGDDDAVLAIGRALAREHHVVAVGRRLHVVHETRVRLNRVDDLRARRVRDVDRVHAVAADVRSEIRDLAVRMNPHLRRRERRHRQATDDGDRATHVAFVDVHDRRCRLSAERRGHQVFAGPVGDEAAVRIELSVAGREGPRRRQSSDRVARRILRVDAEADDVALANGRLVRLDGQRRDRIRDDFDLRRGARSAGDRGERRRSRSDRGDDSRIVGGEHARVARLPGDALAGAILSRRERNRGETRLLPGDELPRLRQHVESRRGTGHGVQLDRIDDRPRARSRAP